MKACFRQRPYWRKVYVSLRDSWLLFGEFQWALIAFMGATIGGGLLYYTLAKLATEAINSPVENGQREAALRAANIQEAETIIPCTQNDSLNLQIALKARSINPNIRVVLRIFDDDFATALEKQFGFIAISATGRAAPAFAPQPQV